MKYYTFVEPHITGGDSTVRITEKQIIKYMTTIKEKNPKLKKISDDVLLNEFISNHWCIENEV